MTRRIWAEIRRCSARSSRLSFQRTARPRSSSRARKGASMAVRMNCRRIPAISAIPPASCCRVLLRRRTERPTRRASPNGGARQPTTEGKTRKFRRIPSQCDSRTATFSCSVRMTWVSAPRRPVPDPPKRCGKGAGWFGHDRSRPARGHKKNPATGAGLCNVSKGWAPQAATSWMSSPSPSASASGSASLLARRGDFARLCSMSFSASVSVMRLTEEISRTIRSRAAS